VRHTSGTVVQPQQRHPSRRHLDRGEETTQTAPVSGGRSSSSTGEMFGLLLDLRHSDNVVHKSVRSLYSHITLLGKVIATLTLYLVDVSLSF
jgi:hypothetical protein